MAPTRKELRLSATASPDEYTPEEQKRLTDNLTALLRRIHAGEFSVVPLEKRLLRDLHASLFDGVREHAGRARSPHFGSERLTFGPNRSVHRDRVRAELFEAFEQARRSLKSLEDHPDDPDYERGALHLAVWVHAKVIRVHPFQDGNGRTSRALLDIVLVRLGLNPLPIDAPKQEYVDCLNNFFRTSDLDPLFDLCLRLYPLED